jgi:hypothetical protein
MQSAPIFTKLLPAFHQIVTPARNRAAHYL